IEPDLPAFEELDETDALDVFWGKALVALVSDELEGVQAADALDRLTGGGTQLLRRQLRNGVILHGAPALHRSRRRSRAIAAGLGARTARVADLAGIADVRSRRSGTPAPASDHRSRTVTSRSS